MVQYTEIDVDGNPMRVGCSVPDGDGLHPAIVVMYHRGGFDDFTVKVCDDLAEAGYIAASMDLYHWPPLLDPPQENPFPKDPEIIRDITATVDWLAARSDVDLDKVGILGHCMGGRMALLGASTHEVFKACVPYYPGNMFKPWSEDGPAPFDLLSGIKGTVHGFFGNDDQNPSPADREKISAELTRLRVDHEFYSYDGAGHAFQNFLAPERFRPEATSESWEKTVAYLDNTLKG
jgi:carboxymethylenebutenolidase